MQQHTRTDWSQPQAHFKVGEPNPIRGKNFLMGSSSRAKPQRLSSKLRQIREALGISQTAMGKLLGLNNEFARNYVSGYERNTREPTLKVLLRYSEVCGLWINTLVDDGMELPKELPRNPMQEGIKRSAITQVKRKR
jgi:transcriptional regulator with XRE-family HTH domain